MPETQSLFVIPVAIPNHHHMPIVYTKEHLDESQLGSGDVERVNVGGETGVGLLGAVRAIK